MCTDHFAIIEFIFAYSSKQESSAFCQFLSQLLQKILFFHYGPVCLIAIFVSGMKTIRRKYFYPMLIIWAVFGATIITLQYSIIKTAGRLTILSYENRVWAIPLAFIGLIAVYELLRKQKYRLNQMQLIIIMVAGLTMIFFELKIIIGQAQYTKRLTSLINTRKGCYLLTPYEFFQLEEHYFIPTWSLGYTVVLFNKSMEPSTVFTTEQYNQKRELIYNDFCKIREGNRLSIYDGWSNYDLFIDRQISFKKIFPAIDKK